MDGVYENNVNNNNININILSLLATYNVSSINVCIHVHDVVVFIKLCFFFSLLSFFYYRENILAHMTISECVFSCSRSPAVFG